MVWADHSALQMMAEKPGKRPAAAWVNTPEGMPTGESNKFVYDGERPARRISGTTARQHPWEFKRVWHLEPSLTIPIRSYAGVEDAAIFKSHRRRHDVARTARPARQAKAPQWQPGAGGMGLHTIFSIRRIRIASSSPSRPPVLPHRRRRQVVEADQSRAAIRVHARPDRRGRPLRASHRDASVAAEYALHAEALGRDAHRRCRR